MFDEELNTQDTIMSALSQIKTHLTQYEADHPLMSEKLLEETYEIGCYLQASAKYGLVKELYLVYKERIGLLEHVVSVIKGFNKADWDGDTETKTKIDELFKTYNERKREFVNIKCQIVVLQANEKDKEETKESSSNMEEILAKLSMNKSHKVEDGHERARYFKMENIKFDSFGPGDKFNEWLKAFNMATEGMKDTEKLIFLKSKVTGSAKDCIRNINLSCGGYQHALENLKRTYGDPIKNASEDMANFLN